jgi:DNA gyrase subunit A
MDDQITALTKPENEPEEGEVTNDGSKAEPEEVLPKGVIKTDITDEMQKAYLDYAMSVIVSRALPDVRDGLKPVQRRIIYAMQDQNMPASGKFHKCAAVVGEVLKKYHPHGDSSVYEALVRMGQDFSLRYPLIFPQGNFGSIDGDNPAAMRYTECKLQKISEELYTDIEKETVPYEMNDLQNHEPLYLPSLLPNILLNGASGIAVGMATNIPPHNLGEVVDGISHLIEKADEIGSAPTEKDVVPVRIFDQDEGMLKIKVSKTKFASSATVEDLVQHIKGPDFPTGGTIYDQKELTQMYATGKGRVVTRAKMDVEEMKNGKMRLVVSEIPYQVNKSTLIAKIADLVKLKRVEGISDLRDESNKKGMRIVIELKKEAVVKRLQNQLYKFTPLQSTFNTNMVALLDNEPRLMTLKMILEDFTRHRQEIVIKRTLFLLKKAKEREHILQGLKIALDNIDEVIKLIRASKDAETAKSGLMKKFGLTSIQAQAILDMQLRKLAALERQKIEDELKEIIETIKGLEALLASPKDILAKVKEELVELKKKYNDDRRTQVVKGMVGDLSDEDLIAEERCLVTISEGGYIKRLKEDTYRKQGRGGRGKVGQSLKEEDHISTVRTCNTHDWAFFLTNKGRVYKMRIWELPEASRTSKGTPIVNFLSMTQKETVQAFFTLENEELEAGKDFVFFATERGRVKRTSLKDFANIRSSGIIAIKISEGDELIFAGLASEGDEVLLTTKKGQSIRFKGKDVRPMGRSAGGVTGVRLAKAGDKVVGAVVTSPEDKDTYLITVAESGYGKKTPVSEYKVQNRGGSGILTYKVTGKTGGLVAARSVTKGAGSDLLIATQSGIFIRLGTRQIPVLGRATQGVRLIKLDSGDKVTSVALLEPEEEKKEEKPENTK